MIIHLKHSVHGKKIATLELEAEADEARGWVRYNPLEPVIEEASANALEPRRRRKVPVETQEEE